MPRAGVVLAAALLAACGGHDAADAPSWPQWAQNPQHTGVSSAAGQQARRVIARLVSDPFVESERAEHLGALLVHYAVPLLAGDDLYFAKKSGTYTGRGEWSSQVWEVDARRWDRDTPAPRFSFASDWKPVPADEGPRVWEPVFQPALAGDRLYVPGAGGSLHVLDRASGAVRGRVRPFGEALDPDIYVAGPLSVDAEGRVYYHALRLDHDDPWGADIRGAWLVRVTPAGEATTVSLTTLVPDKPAGQRPGLNVAPAIAPDGTIYTISRSHADASVAYMVALTSALVPKWAAAIDGSVIDPSTSSPVVAPDGTILYGAFASGTDSRGRLLQWNADGRFLRSYGFGWDTTPAILSRGASFLLVLKENDYLHGGPFTITALHGDTLARAWTYEADEEWCVNAAAVDRDGNVYANSEDGLLHVIGPEGVGRETLRIGEEGESAYTPVALDVQGRVYVQKNGELIVVGE